MDGNDKTTSPRLWKNMIDELTKKIIKCVQGDIPVDPRPFATMAEKIGIEEDVFIERLRELREKGIMRRFGATLRHQEAGFNHNAMVAWVIPEELVEETGKIFSGFREVTHCYQRKAQRDWPFNMYTMIHGKDREQCYEIARKLSLATGQNNYKLLFSQREFKKTSMEYF